jgi:hypothetical protein
VNGMINEEKYLKCRLVSPCNRCIQFQEDQDCGETLQGCRDKIEEIVGKGWFERHPYGHIEDT